MLNFFKRFPAAQGVGDVIDMAAVDPKKVCIGYALPERLAYSTMLAVLIARLGSEHSTRDEIDARAVEVVQELLLTPWRKLSRKPAGSFDLQAEYERRSRKGGSKAKDARKYALRHTKTALALIKEATLHMLDDLAGTAAFDETQLRWLADHIVEITKARKKRWPSVLSLLARADAIRSEELSHLVVVAGVALVESGLVDPGEIRKWLDDHGRLKPWALPIKIAIDKRVE